MDADVFYKKKRSAKLKAKHCTNFMAVAFDFSKNLPLPNITTNDAYYKRQLSVYLFNVHALADSKSYFYLYDETCAKKGSNDVCSMLQHFIATYIPEGIEGLQFFCDSCGGQNKNYTVFRYLHYLVHIAKRFKTTQVCYPIRGHSYMECDKNFAFINQKSPAS